MAIRKRNRKMETDMIHELISLILQLLADSAKVHEDIKSCMNVLQELLNLDSLESHKTVDGDVTSLNEVDQIINEWNTTSTSNKKSTSSLSNESEQESVITEIHVKKAMSSKENTDKDSANYSGNESCISEVCLMGPNNPEQNVRLQWINKTIKEANASNKRLSLKLFGCSSEEYQLSKVKKRRRKSLPTKLTQSVDNTHKNKSFTETIEKDTTSTNVNNSSIRNAISKLRKRKSTKLSNAKSSPSSTKRNSKSSLHGSPIIKQSNCNSTRKSTRITKPVVRRTDDVVVVPNVRLLNTLIGRDIQNRRQSTTKQKTNKLKNETITVNNKSRETSAKAKKRKSTDNAQKNTFSNISNISKKKRKLYSEEEWLSSPEFQTSILP